MGAARIAVVGALLLTVGVPSVVEGEDTSSSQQQLHGSGTTNPSKFVWEVLDLLASRAKNPLSLSYRAVGSTTGQIEFTGDDDSSFLPYNHFGKELALSRMMTAVQC